MERVRKVLGMTLGDNCPRSEASATNSQRRMSEGILRDETRLGQLDLLLLKHSMRMHGGGHPIPLVFLLAQ